MAERKRQYSTYTDDALGDELEAASEASDMSIAKILREGARRQLQQMEYGEEL